MFCSGTVFHEFGFGELEWELGGTRGAELGKPEGAATGANSLDDKNPYEQSLCKEIISAPYLRDVHYCFELANSALANLG